MLALHGWPLFCLGTVRVLDFASTSVAKINLREVARPSGRASGHVPADNRCPNPRIVAAPTAFFH